MFVSLLSLELRNEGKTHPGRCYFFSVGWKQISREWCKVFVLTCTTGPHCCRGTGLPRAHSTFFTKNWPALHLRFLNLAVQWVPVPSLFLLKETRNRYRGVQVVIYVFIDATTAEVLMPLGRPQQHRWFRQVTWPSFLFSEYYNILTLLHCFIWISCFSRILSRHSRA